MKAGLLIGALLSKILGLFFRALDTSYNVSNVEGDIPTTVSKRSVTRFKPAPKTEVATTSAFVMSLQSQFNLQSQSNIL